MSVFLALLLTLRSCARSRAVLQLEVLTLRHQLQVLQRTRPRRMRLDKADRWLWMLLSRVWTEWRSALVIVQPETVIGWHRRGFQMFWDLEEPATHRSSDRPGGRARADSHDVADEPAMGRASDPRRIAQAGD